MTRIATSTYRYKPPPKRKGRTLAEIIGPAVVVGKGGRRPVVHEAAAEGSAPPAAGGTGQLLDIHPPGRGGPGTAKHNAQAPA